VENGGFEQPLLDPIASLMIEKYQKKITRTDLETRILKLV
jgi:hypothetical protein